MARQPTVPVLAGTGSGIIPPQSQIKPDTKLILDLSGGLNTSRPPDQVEDRDSPEMKNLVYMHKVLCVDFGFRPLGSKVEGIPQQPIEWTNPETGSRWMLLVTTSKVYFLNDATQDWVLVPGSPTLTSDGSIQVSWCTDPSHAWLIFVNGFDPPYVFDGNSCFALPGVAAISLSTARHVCRFHGVTVLANVVEGGREYVYRVRRSATNDPTNWASLDAGFDDLVDTGDPITDVLPVNPYLVFMRGQSIVRATYYGMGLQVFWYDYGLTTTGAIADQASINTKTSLIFVSESGIYQYDGNYGLTDVGEKVHSTLLTYTGELNLNSTLPIFLMYVPMSDETWIFYSNFRAQWPNMTLRLNHSTGAWFKRAWANPCMFAGAGLYSQPTAMRWIDLGNTRWIDRHRPWHARGIQPLFQSIVLCGAEDNQTYLYDWNTTVTDNGLVIDWYYTSKDYPIPDEWRTVDGIVFYGKGIVNLVEISVDFGVTWQQLAQNVVMGPTWARGDADCSITAEFVRIRFSGNDPSFKLSWFAFRTMSASER